MDKCYVQALAVLAVIVYTVIGLDYAPHGIEQEVSWVLSHPPGNKSGNFSFFSCSRKNSILNFTTLVISPDPILFNRWNKSNMNVFGKYTLTETIFQDHPIEVDIRLRLKIQDGYTELCELIGEENCHLSDLIQELKKYYNFNVTIPLDKGEHHIPNVGLLLPVLPFILKGRFEATLYLKYEGQPLGCVTVRFCVTECMFYH